MRETYFTSCLFILCHLPNNGTMSFVFKKRLCLPLAICTKASGLQPFISNCTVFSRHPHPLHFYWHFFLVYYVLVLSFNTILFEKLLVRGPEYLQFYHKQFLCLWRTCLISWKFSSLIGKMGEGMHQLQSSCEGQIEW